jgi:hypothetical protein
VKDIQENMPKLPFLKRYFDLLGLITCICYYYSSLKEMGRWPCLDQLEVLQGHVPKIFPPIPVRHFVFYQLIITFRDIIQAYNRTHGQARSPLDIALRAAFDSGDFSLSE